MEVVKLVIGAALIILGIVLIVLKLAIVFGWLSPPEGGMFRQEAEDGATAWDFLLALLDKTGWSVPVGIILIVLGSLLMGVDFKDVGSLLSTASPSSQGGSAG